MVIDDVTPAGFVERFAVRGEQVARFVDVGVDDGLGPGIP